MHRRWRNWSTQGEPMMGSPGPEGSRELVDWRPSSSLKRVVINRQDERGFTLPDYGLFISLSG